MADASDSLPTQAGTLYPKDHLVALMADGEAAAAGVAALREAGWEGEAVASLSGEEFVARYEAQKEQQSPFEKLASVLASDERLAQEQYVDEARRGRHLLFARAATLEDAHRASTALAPLRPLVMQHFGELHMTDIKPGLPTQEDR